MIAYEEVRTFRRKLFCDVCHKEMKGTGIALMSMPPQYQHACLNGHIKVMRESFPNIVHVTTKEYEELVAKDLASQQGDASEEHH